LGIKDHADPSLAEFCHDFRWIGLGRIGAAIRFLRRRGVADATMAGKIQKVRLFEPWTIARHLPDWTGLRTFYPHFVSRRQDRRDDTLLSAIVGAFGRGGVRLLPATDFAPELLVKAGCLTRREPTAAERKDIQFGWILAKEMGRLDVGQSVVVKDQAPLAVEAIEGTDECIRRAGLLCAQGGFTVVKVAKPQQDMRFDVPTIGVGTLHAMAASGAKVLAIEADRTILVDRDEFLAVADRNNLVVVSVAAEEVGIAKE
jgi:DUF1009 family protein